MSLSEEMFLKFNKEQMWKVYKELLSEKESLDGIKKVWTTL